MVRKISLVLGVGEKVTDYTLARALGDIGRSLKLQDLAGAKDDPSGCSYEIVFRVMRSPWVTKAVVADLTFEIVDDTHAKTTGVKK